MTNWAKCIMRYLCYSSTIEKAIANSSPLPLRKIQTPLPPPNKALKLDIIILVSDNHDRISSVYNLFCMPKIVEGTSSRNHRQFAFHQYSTIGIKYIGCEISFECHDLPLRRRVRD